MLFHRPNPAKSFEQLRDRIDWFFSKPSLNTTSKNQLTLDLLVSGDLFEEIETPNRNATEFLNFISDSLPTGDLYLFGGLVRDIALFGKKGFNSDIDLVVDGDWINCIPYLEHLGAKLNKFGGYRLVVSGQLVDIWNAQETWAINKGLVKYKGIASLNETTVLNWDAILMNWRTKRFICNNNYLEELSSRMLDVVLESNPNPTGMAVRVLRHLCLKDAKKITPKAAIYLSICTRQYSFQELRESELQSYGNSAIEYVTYKFFESLNQCNDLSIHQQVDAASELIKQEGLTLSSIQTECDFGNLVQVT